MKIKNSLKFFQSFSFIIPLLVITIIFTLIPLINTFIDSFKVYERYSRVDYNYGIGNFGTVIHSKDFKWAFINSNVVMLIATPIGIIIAFIFSIMISSIFSRITKNIIITILYSQFFISAFAIGTSFTFLFGSQKDAFNKVFGTNYDFTHSKTYFLYIIYQLWRIVPFNSVLFTFSISRGLEKNWKKTKIDKLGLKDKIFNIYLYEIKKSILLVIYINFVSAILLYPRAILGTNFNLGLYNAHTLTSYIFDFIVPSRSATTPNDAAAGAASIIVFLYIFGLFIAGFVIKNLISRLSTFIRNQRIKRGEYV